SNIGHGSEATHTNDESSPFSNMLTKAMDFPLEHPPFIVRNQQADDFTENILFDYHPRLFKRVQKKIKNIIKSHKR
ncbi:MAG: glycosyltransferase family 2 protein, partial [Microcoleus sp. SIO2G3]|nr:glycosyltransferase family 2 protein [Microcoleus sp. SIO2G3]